MKKKQFVFIVVIVGFFLLLHSTPNLALRTRVAFMGHPISALTTGITTDDYHNKVDKIKFEQSHSKAYMLTNPPIERATQSYLQNYVVKRVVFLYFAKYLGEE